MFTYYIQTLADSKQRLIDLCNFFFQKQIHFLFFGILILFLLIVNNFNHRIWCHWFILFVFLLKICELIYSVLLVDWIRIGNQSVLQSCCLLISWIHTRCLIWSRLLDNFCRNLHRWFGKNIFNFKFFLLQIIIILLILLSLQEQLTLTLSVFRWPSKDSVRVTFKKLALSNRVRLSTLAIIWVVITIQAEHGFVLKVP